MRSLRRLSVVSIASLPAVLLLCTAGASAQTAAALSTQPAPLQNPVPFVAPVLPPLSPNTMHHLQEQAQALKAQQTALLAQNNGPCYTLRTYGFTTGHDPAEAPRLSSHTTCTPASKSHVRELVN